MTVKNTKTKSAGRTKATASAPPNNAMKVHAKESDNVATATAAAILAPEFRHAVTASQIHKAQFGSMEGSPGFGDYADVLDKVSERARKGDLAMASELLAAQALTLDNIFTEMARRMAINMGEYLGATETYGRIALKAQAGSRATLAELAKLHQPREQTVRHVHVNEGGQAVIADEFHNHTGVQENGHTDTQPHATGTRAVGTSTSLPSPDPIGPAVPVASCEGKQTVPNARRQGKRST